jgi:archaeosine-15-forming tRNA-guanine transglycosylase
MFFLPKEQSSTAPTPQVAVITESEQNTVPFSYNVPVDSHVNYKNDVVIVVEHPDERVAIGMVPR